MFSDYEELSSHLMYYPDNPNSQKTRAKIHVGGPNFGNTGNILKISMEKELGLFHDDFGRKQTNSVFTILGATGFDSSFTELVDPLLCQDSFPLLDDDYTASLDLTTIQLDSLDMAGPIFEEDLPGLRGILCSSVNECQDNYKSDRHGSDLSGKLGEVRSGSTSREPPRSQGPRRSTRAAAAVAAATLAQVMQDSVDSDSDTQYPTLVDVGVTMDEVPRRRQSRVSCSTITEKRQQQLRNLNNAASRKYREKMGSQHEQLQQLENQERHKNQQLLKKAEGLQKLRDQIARFSQTFMRQQLVDDAMSPNKTSY